MSLSDELPERGHALYEQMPKGSQRSRVHPLTWAALVAMVPLLSWDVWQTMQDVKHRHQASQVRSLTTEGPRTAFE
jgi:hypothetical protein